MNILFEEDGAFRAGTVLADNNTSLQVELASGKRTKVKAANVLLRFTDPSPADLSAQAEADAQAIDADFLWEACGDSEFAFADFASDYHGRAPVAVESAALLFALHAAPIYFHRKGKGRFRKAPADILKAALAGQEKKRLQALAVERMSASLVRRELPEEFAGQVPQLLYKPDRGRLETKALEAACAETGLSPQRLLFECGGITGHHDYHLGRFLFEHFPEGTEFPDYTLPDSAGEAPLAQVSAFSIDDAHTTEIDDAFSVTPTDKGWRIGIHIAAPGLVIRPDDALGAIARERLSTVYMPGTKITMLPEAVVERYTLAAGRICPALSLYLEVGRDLTLRVAETLIERVPVVANLRHHDVEPLFNEESLSAGLADFPYRDELKLLWEVATVLEAGRGKASVNQNFFDYNFAVDWSVATPEGQGRVSITRRSRGSPLDKLVAELMIAANASWGRALADAGLPALYRAQSAGKVRMTTVPAAHEGLGVDCYAWASSPLRRYTDLVNQWQLIAWLRQEEPPFAPRSQELLATLREFELAYAAYAEFQGGMERYWCLRYLVQEGLAQVNATVLRENLVRVDDIPLVLRVPTLPALDRGARVSLAIERIDLLEAEARVRFVEVLATDAGATMEAPELGADIASASAIEGPPAAE